MAENTLAVLAAGLAVLAATACEPPAEKAWGPPAGPTGRVTEVRNLHVLTVQPPHGPAEKVVVNKRQARACHVGTAYPACLPSGIDPDNT
ncbi:hypothetical protein [Microbispora triticiradicis]|uniref:Lipoprotein n=2 Tax=Microbispora TaxID=2005 RepID=A0ABY3LQ06_9ACTN|nr:MULTISPECIES: hypothetical protein [Microbispora]TLP66521.1 hypothetical protein FED44_03410 [Microbispora fusca]TYB47414.1 hypothetical protein FXF59_29810 [Microbispora tritici]